jgi:hypothetical protein
MFDELVDMAIAKLVQLREQAIKEAMENWESDYDPVLLINAEGAPVALESRDLCVPVRQVDVKIFNSKDLH